MYIRLARAFRHIYALIRPADWIALFLSIIIVVLVVRFSLRNSEGDPIVYIKSSTDEYFYTLDSSERIILTGPLGATVVRIDNGTVWVDSSPGKRQLCVMQGAISRINEWLICLPNEILVHITAQRGADNVDGHSY